MTWGCLLANFCRGSPKENRNIRAALLMKINCHQKSNKERENTKLEIFSLSLDVCVIGEAISRKFENIYITLCEIVSMFISP